MLNETFILTYKRLIGGSAIPHPHSLRICILHEEQSFGISKYITKGGSDISMRSSKERNDLISRGSSVDRVSFYPIGYINLTGHLP